MLGAIAAAILRPTWRASATSAVRAWVSPDRLQAGVRGRFTGELRIPRHATSARPPRGGLEPVQHPPRFLQAGRARAGPLVAAGGQLFEQLGELAQVAFELGAMSGGCQFEHRVADLARLLQRLQCAVAAEAVEDPVGSDRESIDHLEQQLSVRRRHVDTTDDVRTSNQQNAGIVR